MAILPAATNPKATDYEVEFELNDLGGRVVNGALTYIPVPADEWPIQSTIYAQDTNTFWKVVEQPVGTVVAMLLSDPSATSTSITNGSVDYELDVEPVVTSVVVAQGGRPASLLQRDGVLYVICFGLGGVPSRPPRFETYDVNSDPTTPLLLASVASNPAGQNNHYDLEKVGDYVLTCFQGTAPGGGVMAWDVSNPSTPTIAGQYRVGGANSQCFDLAVRPDQQVVALAFTNNGVGTIFVDVSALPTITPVGASIAGAFVSVAFSTGGGVLYASNFGTGQLQVYDVSSLAAPVLVTSIPFTVGIRQCRVDGNRLYVIDRNQLACSIFDITNPLAPVLLSSFPLACNNDETQPITPIGNLFISGSSDVNPGAVYMFDVSTGTRARLLRRPLFSDGAVVTETLFDAALNDNNEYLYASNRGGTQNIVTFRIRGGATPPRAQRIPWYRTVTAADRVAPTDMHIGADATVAPFAVTLPSPGAVPGQTFTLTKIDGTVNAVTLNVLGGGTISGAATFVLAALWSSVTVYSTGTTYIRIASV
jgi:hypothetical protein